MTNTNWVSDPSHSEIHFKVKHLMISTVSGSFDDFSVNVNTDNENFANAQISFTANSNSVNTRSEQRDAHLKSPDFFDAENYPELKFQSTSFIKDGDGF